MSTEPTDERTDPESTAPYDTLSGCSWHSESVQSTERSEFLDGLAITYLVICGISVLQWVGGHRGRRAARERQRAEIDLFRAQTRLAYASARTEDMEQYRAAREMGTGVAW